ncbi:ergothioneine biosynthesis protein EgtB [Legionella sp. D16C41]|uniref:ergothioneine biosynthesis protein EgtB n=1 Tax=Legionella sp. D16C41 TaxID=3402688 RepID=UPI003AF93A84
MQASEAIYDNEKLSFQELKKYFQFVRQKTEEICSPLLTEDYVIQGMPDVSPPKWHLAHTTWFFETFILLKYGKCQPFKAAYDYLFNSYYLGINQPFPRPNRGLLARPSVDEIYNYRHHINSLILELTEQKLSDNFNEVYNLIRLGIEHEQQHQELLLMDIKYNFSLNPELPVYYTLKDQASLNIVKKSLEFIPIKGDKFIMGSSAQNFCFDNELPQHQILLDDFLIANKLVTNGEYLEFMLSGGYENAILWLSDGWSWLQDNGITKPLYWFYIDASWYEYTLTGLKPLNLDEPVCHISYFEADAYARWKSCRLPTEEEWEYAVTKHLIPLRGNFLEQSIYHPQAAYQQKEKSTLLQFFGDLWEWTASPYRAYPRYKPFSGSIGEYNGKFMNNQYVLRGGCCVTSQSHMRATYRNFYQPEKQWAFSGIRLAQDY